MSSMYNNFHITAARGDSSMSVKVSLFFYLWDSPIGSMHLEPESNVHKHLGRYKDHSKEG